MIYCPMPSNDHPTVNGWSRTLPQAWAGNNYQHKRLCHFKLSISISDWPVMYYLFQTEWALAPTLPVAAAGGIFIQLCLKTHMWWRDSAMETHGKIFPTNGKVFISILEKAFKNTHFLSKLNEMSLRMFEKKQHRISSASQIGNTLSNTINFQLSCLKQR